MHVMSRHKPLLAVTMYNLLFSLTHGDVLIERFLFGRGMALERKT